MTKFTVVLDDRDSDAVYDSVDCDEWWEVLDVIEKWADEITGNVAISIVDREHFKGS